MIVIHAIDIYILFTMADTSTFVLFFGSNLLVTRRLFDGNSLGHCPLKSLKRNFSFHWMPNKIVEELSHLDFCALVLTSGTRVCVKHFCLGTLVHDITMQKQMQTLVCSRPEK